MTVADFTTTVKIHLLFIALAICIPLTGCATDANSHTDDVPVNIAPDNSHNHVYAANATDPTSYRQTLTDRAYDNSDANNPAKGKGYPPPPNDLFDN